MSTASPFLFSQELLSKSQARLSQAPSVLSLRQRQNTPAFREALRQAGGLVPGTVKAKHDTLLTTAKPNSTQFNAYLSFYNPLFLHTQPDNGINGHNAFFGIFPKNPNVPSVRVDFKPSSPEKAYLVEFHISLNPATADQEWHFKLRTFLFNQPQANYNLTGDPGHQTLSLLVPPFDTNNNTVELLPNLDKNPTTQQIPTTWAWTFYYVTITEFSS